VPAAPSSFSCIAVLVLCRYQAQAFSEETLIQEQQKAEDMLQAANASIAPTAPAQQPVPGEKHAFINILDPFTLLVIVDPWSLSIMLGQPA